MYLQCRRRVDGLLKGFGSPALTLMRRMNVDGDLGCMTVSGAPVKITESHPADALMVVLDNPEGPVCAGGLPPNGDIIRGQWGRVGRNQSRGNRGVVHLCHE